METPRQARFTKIRESRPTLVDPRDCTGKPLGGRELDRRRQTDRPGAVVLRRNAWRPGNHVWPGRDVYRRRARANPPQVRLSMPFLTCGSCTARSPSTARRCSPARRPSCVKLIPKSGPAVSLFISVTNFVDPVRSRPTARPPIFGDHRNIDGRSCRSGRRFTMPLVKSTVVVQDVTLQTLGRHLPAGSFGPSEAVAKSSLRPNDVDLLRRRL